MNLRNGFDILMDKKIEKEMENLVLPPPPVFDNSYTGYVIAAGLPTVPKEKTERLKSYLTEKMQQNLRKTKSVTFPMNDKGETKGIAFVQFFTNDMAKDVIKQLNGTMFDKKHTYRLILLNEFQNIIETDETFIEPPKLEFKYKDNMFSWLLNDKCYDQFLVNHNHNSITVYEMAANQLNEQVNRSRFTDIHSFWSTKGLYLASMHSRGVALWGNPEFEQIAKFSHKGVQHLSFSPQEKYLVTYSEVSRTIRILIWNIIEEREIREFLIDSEMKIGTGWPKLQWSHDDEYFAIIQTNKLSVYHSNTCVLLDKKSIEVAGIADFYWANKSHLISYWVPESSTPAKIVLLDIPSKREIFVKSLLNVCDICLHWSSNDDYLAVIGERYAKKKMTPEGIKYIGATANVEIFRVQEKEIPVEKIDMKEKKSIVDFQWEPNGTRCAMIATQQNNHYLIIYDIKNVGQVQEVKTHAFTATLRFNLVRWSPNGQYLCCATVKGNNIEFVDGSDGTSFLKGEHQNLSDLYWDPTGRYIVSCHFCMVGNEMNTCVVKFWSIAGKCLMEKQFTGLKQFLWRPRPPTCIPESKIKEVKKNMAKYNQRFAQDDELMSNESKRLKVEERRRLMAEFDDKFASVLERFKEERPIRLERRRGIDTDSIDAAKETENIMLPISSKIIAA